MATSPKSGEKTPDQQQLPAQKAQREPQDAAYARAQDAIATARTSDASDLTLSGDDFSDLTELPPDIGTLTALTDLSLSGTPVCDISALSALLGLSELELRRTPVSDISALSGLIALSRLYLSGTPVSDISALSGLEGLIDLDLSGTQVSDLSPLLSLTQLADAPQSAGLAFTNTVAALSDSRIAEIAKIEDNAKRATGLFAYLREIPKGVARSIEKLDTRVGTTQQDVTELETRVSTAIKRLDRFDADYESRLKAAAAAFREDNALKAPVVLWQEKETKHQAESATARTFFIWSLIVTGLLVIVLALFLIFSKDVAYALVAPIGCDPAKPETCSGFSARGLSILTLVAAFFTCLLWYVRMQMKLFLSERHLALDARERTAFAQTYIGFLAEKDSSDEAAGQRAAVYAALFRPSTDGIVKDEGGLDPSIAAALSKFLTKLS